MPSDARPAVLLDRDGTLMRDVGYPRDPDDVELLPGAAPALAALRDAGFALAVVSNQSGVARGLVTRDEAAAVHERLVAELGTHGIELDGAYYCFHVPADGCACRKPAPGLLHDAARELGLALECSVMVGDRASDVDAGRAAGCRLSLLFDGSWDAIARLVLAQECAP
jgi:D-glycero-D-manno-heptose 1,7-bisphosphate phosphatase